MVVPAKETFSAEESIPYPQPMQELVKRVKAGGLRMHCTVNFTGKVREEHTADGFSLYAVSVVVAPSGMRITGDGNTLAAAVGDARDKLNCLLDANAIPDAPVGAVCGTIALVRD